MVQAQQSRDLNTRRRRTENRSFDFLVVEGQHRQVEVNTGLGERSDRRRDNRATLGQDGAAFFNQVPSESTRRQDHDVAVLTAREVREETECRVECGRRPVGGAVLERTVHLGLIDVDRDDRTRTRVHGTLDRTSAHATAPDHGHDVAGLHCPAVDS